MIAPRVAVLGATGYVGMELLRLLANRDDVEVVFLSSQQHAGVPAARVSPSLALAARARGWVFQPLDAMPEVDIAISCLPSGALPEHLPAVEARAPLIINVAGDYRFSDPALIGRHYPAALEQPRPAAVYTIPELAGRLPQAGLINLPGCTAVTAFYALYPLFSRKLVAPSVVVEAKTGASGAGKHTGEPAAERSHNVRAYKLHGHRHAPEICMAIESATGARPDLQFSVVSLDLPRGIFLTAYARLQHGVSAVEVRKAYVSSYRDAPFVRVLPPGHGTAALPQLKAVLGTNYAAIGIAVEDDRVAVVACADNLVKGAAGQAVQVVNRLIGAEESAGLLALGLWP